MKDNPSLLRYSLFGDTVEAFSTRKDSRLPYNVVLGDQVHDIRTAVVRVPDPDPATLSGTDALVTNLRGVAIGIRTADCIPILLYDPVRKAVAAVHAGWKGTLRRIVCSSISLMGLEYGSSPADLLAVIGPGICKASFQVGEEVPLAFKNLGFPMDRIYSWEGGKIKGDVHTGHHIDLIAANIWLMTEVEGMLPQNIHQCGIDTFTDESFYSARRDGSEAGRIITAIMLK